MKGDEARKVLAYEKLRRSGRCNMLDYNCVKVYTRLDRVDIHYIITNYNELLAKYAMEVSRLENECNY